MTQMQYLQFFADKEELLEPFDDAERGRLFTAMLSYSLHCEEIPLTGNERFVWPVFKQMIDTQKQDPVKTRRSTAYKKWRNAVLVRDKYRCAKCGTQNRTMHAHHIRPFALFPDERLNIKNGITLCEACHIEEHKRR